MKNIDYLIIGGGIAGVTAAETIRQNDSSGLITIVSEEPEPFYSRVLLPNYLRDEIPLEGLFIRNPKDHKERGIDLLKRSKANKVNTQDEKVYLTNGQELGYKKLLIASGGKPTLLELPGADLTGVTYMRTIEDINQIKRLMQLAKAGVVIGAGFIGLEYAQSFVKKGLKTIYIIRKPYFWSKMASQNLGVLINRILRNNSVELITRAQVIRFLGDGSLRSVRLDNGKSIQAEVAGVGIGTRMDLGYLAGSGVKIDNGVITNEYLECSAPDVWAAGDIAEFFDVLFDKQHRLGNWTNAAAQGKTAGLNMIGGWGSVSKNREKSISVSAYTVSLFGHNLSFIGDVSRDEETEIIERGSISEGKLGCLFLRGRMICGAALINLPADRKPIEELIKYRVKITASRDKLADKDFDLGDLLNS